MGSFFFLRRALFDVCPPWGLVAVRVSFLIRGAGSLTFVCCISVLSFFTCLFVCLAVWMQERFARLVDAGERGLRVLLLPIRLRRNVRDVEMWLMGRVG